MPAPPPLFERSGVAPDQLRFCLERPQKAEHCRGLAITQFVNDRSDVLEHLEGVVRNRCLFGLQGMPHHMPGIVAVPTWEGGRAALLTE